MTGQIVEILAVADADFRDKDDEFVLSVTVGGKTVYEVSSSTRDYEKQVVMLFRDTLAETAEVKVYLSMRGKLDKNITFKEGSIQLSFKGFEAGSDPVGGAD